MIYGVGTDLIETKRVESALRNEAFLKHAFTEDERRQADGKSKRLVGDFAVKEAVAKALKTGFRGFELKDIEVLRDDLGAPYVKLHGNTKALAADIGIKNIQVSIADIKEFVTAYAVIEI
ncbi:MAG: holo-ACP synthase [Eubacteriales bacterium]|nr:holo-ACP synthase [Eubacteriales bacterium]